MNEIPIQQGTPEWLEWRKSKIGASDAATIMGVSPWMTPFQLWEEKMGLSKPRETSAAMQRGKDMEKEALIAFEAQTGLVMFPKIYVNYDFSWMIASLDGVDFDRTCFVEIKCPGKVDHAIAQEGNIPDKYKPQIQHQFAVAKMEKAFYFSYNGTDGVCIEVKPDGAYIEKLIAKEKEFWRCMQDFDPPELSDRDCIEMTSEEWRYVVQDYKHYSTMLKQIEAILEKDKEKLIKMCGGLNARGFGLKLMKSFRKGVVDVDALAEAAKLDKEQFRKKPTNYWRIT